MVYVDEIREYPDHLISKAARRYGNRWSHLTADSKEELHAFAAKLGLRRSWFQDAPVLWHYDLVPAKRQLAIENGAVEVSLREHVRYLLRRHRDVQEELEEGLGTSGGRIRNPDYQPDGAEE